LLILEKLPISIRAQMSCVGVAVDVGVREDVAVGVAVGVAVRVGV